MLLDLCRASSGETPLHSSGSKGSALQNRSSDLQKEFPFNPGLIAAFRELRQLGLCVCFHYNSRHGNFLPGLEAGLGSRTQWEIFPCAGFVLRKPRLAHAVRADCCSSQASRSRARSWGVLQQTEWETCPAVQGEKPLMAPTATCERAAQPGAGPQSRAHPSARWAELGGSSWERGLAGKWGDSKGAQLAALPRGHGAGALPVPRCPDRERACTWASGHQLGQGAGAPRGAAAPRYACASPRTPAGTQPCRYGFAVGGCIPPSGAVIWTQAWPRSPGSGLKRVSALSPAGSSTSAPSDSSEGRNGSALPLSLNPFTAEDFYFLTG